MTISKDREENHPGERQHRLARNFRGVFDAIPIAIALQDEDGAFVELNDTFVSMTGYDRRDIVGTRGRKFSFWLDPVERENAHDLARKNSGLHDFKFRFRRKTGDVGVGLISITPIVTDGMGGELTVIRDITERTVTSVEIQLLSHAMESLSEAVCVTDLHGEILFVNKAFCTLYGYHTSEVLGKNITIVRSSCTDPRTLEALRRSTDVGEWHGELTTRKKDRTEFSVLVSTSAVRSGDGKKIAYVATATDITAYKKLDERLLQAREYYRVVLETMPDAVVIINNDGVVEYSSDRADELFGVPAGAGMVGTAAIHYVAQCDRTKMHDLMRQARIDRLTSRLTEFRLQRYDGTEFWGELNSTVIDNPQSHVPEFLVVCRDITGRKLAEESGAREGMYRRNLEAQLQQAEKSRLVGMLVAGIAHDFNNILNIIVGNVDLCLKNQSSHEMHMRRIETIRVAADRGGHVVRQLMMMSRGAAVQPKEVSVNDLIRETASLVQETFSRSIELALQLTDDLPSVMGDAGQLHQLLVNLCVNARDAMPNGGTLLIATDVVDAEEPSSVSPASRCQKRVRITVRDTGTGMDESTRTQIFNPFFTTKEEGEGTGLGLAVVAGIVERHGGTIHVQSQPGVGSEFSVELPGSESRPDMESRETTPTADFRSRDHELILIIEDEEEGREILTEILTDAGYKVVSAINGEDGLNRIHERKDQLSLVLSDLGLPKIEGGVLFQKAKELVPHIPFLLMTGFVDPQRSEQLRGMGVRDVILKPYSTSFILQKVRESLDGARYTA